MYRRHYNRFQNAQDRAQYRRNIKIVQLNEDNDNTIEEESAADFHPLLEFTTVENSSESDPDDSGHQSDSEGSEKDDDDMYSPPTLKPKKRKATKAKATKNKIKRQKVQKVIKSKKSHGEKAISKQESKPGMKHKIPKALASSAIKISKRPTKLSSSDQQAVQSSTNLDISQKPKIESSNISVTKAQVLQAAQPDVSNRGAKQWIGDTSGVDVSSLTPDEYSEHSATEREDDVEAAETPRRSRPTLVSPSSSSIRIGVEYQVSDIPEYCNKRQQPMYREEELGSIPYLNPKNERLAKLLKQFTDGDWNQLMEFTQSCSEQADTDSMIMAAMAKTKPKVKWNKAEVTAFQLGVTLFGKRLAEVAKLVPTRNVHQVVEYYYNNFKYSPRYDTWLKEVEKWGRDDTLEVPSRVPDDPNDSICATCGDTGKEQGRLFCCDACPKVHHKLCLAIAPSELDDFICPSCSKKPPDVLRESVARMKELSRRLELFGKLRLWCKRNNETMFQFLQHRIEPSNSNLALSLPGSYNSPESFDGYLLDAKVLAEVEKIIPVWPLNEQVETLANAGNFTAISNCFDETIVAASLIHVAKSAKKWRSLMSDNSKNDCDK